MSLGGVSGSRVSGSFVLHSCGSKDDSVAVGSSVELLSPVGAPIATFPVSSIVKGAGSAGSGGRVDLLVSFGGFIAATFTDSARLVIYSLAAHTKQNQSTLPERARAILVDAACRYLIVASGTGRVRVYALATGYLVADVKTHHDRGITSLAMDRASRWLVAGGEDGIISVFDFGAVIASAASTAGRVQAASASLVLSIADHSLAITSLRISASNLLLTASKDGSVRAYQIEQPVHAAAEEGTMSSSATGAPAPPCLFHHSFRGIVHAAILDASESIVYVACKENVHWLPLYGPRPSSSTNVATWRGHATTVVSLALSSSGAQLLSLDAEGTCKLWEACAPAPGALPSVQGTCLKTLARRNGCRQVLVAEAPRNAHAATANTHAIQHAPPHRGAGLATKESGWAFPPLNSSPAAIGASGGVHAAGSVLFVPVALVPHGAPHSELRGALKRSGLALNSGADDGSRAHKRRWADDARAEVDASAACDKERSRVLRADWQLVTGTSGWAALAESTTASGNTMGLLQNQAETYATHASELYQLCVDRAWQDFKTPLAAAVGGRK